MRAFLHRGLSLTSCKNPETESVRDQQQGHDESRNEIGGTQLPRHEPGVIGLIESIEEIDCTPDVEDPCYDNAGCTGQQHQRKQGEDSRNDVAIGRGMREGRRQVRRYDPWHQKCQPDKAKAVEDEQRAQGLGTLTEAEFRPDIEGSDYSPRGQAECDAGVKSELRLRRKRTAQFTVVTIQIEARAERGQHEPHKLAKPVAESPFVAERRRITTSDRFEVFGGATSHIEHVGCRCAPFKGAALVIVNVVANATEQVDWIAAHSCDLHEQPSWCCYEPD